MSAYEVLVDALRGHGSMVVDRGGGRASAQCPAHDDRNPSLSVGPRNDGAGVVITCHSGCDYEDILGALSLCKRDLFDDAGLRDVFAARATYVYPGGRRVHRKPDKSFPQSGDKTDRSLFHVDRIGATGPVYVPEGEKDVLAIEAVGGIAVCPAMGAGKAKLADWSPLTTRDVVVVADKDEPGYRHAGDVIGLLRNAGSVRVVEAKAGKDAADHIAAGYGLADFVAVDLGTRNGHSPQPDPARFFHPRDGLLASTLAETVTSGVVCGFGEHDERFYVYADGVWAPNGGRIETQVSRLLGERFRDGYCRTAMSKIRYSDTTPRITCDPLPGYINTVNGMVDWDTGKLLAHSPDYLSTVQLPVAYDADATCPRFEEFLSEVLPADCIQPSGTGPGFIWELIGYTLFSGNPLHIAVLLYGNGRNGKGTLIRVLKHLLGERNCSTATLHDLAENRFRTASLFGKLANLAGDLDARWLDNTATFKAITGGDMIQAEHKYGAAFDFTPWCTPFYSANRAFGSSDSSEGWVARWVVVPFPNSFIGREDRELDIHLHTGPELQGILAKGIAALPALMARGRLPEPDSVRHAKTAFIAASDAVRSWVDDRCKLDPDAFTPRTDAYRAYKQAAEDDNAKPLSAREFYNRLSQLNGVWPHKRDGDRGFKGIRLHTIPTQETLS